MNTYSFTCSIDAHLSTILKIMEEKGCLIERLEKLENCFLVIYRNTEMLYGFPYEL